MRTQTAALVALAAILVLVVGGCASSLRSPPGPGVAETCYDVEEANPGRAYTKPGGIAQAPAASANMEASNQPNMEEVVPVRPNTYVSRGAGAQMVEATSAEDRSLAGAPSVNQCIIQAPAAAAAAAQTPRDEDRLEYRAQLRETQREAIRCGDVATRDWATDELKRLDEEETKLAEVAPAATTNNYWHFEGARFLLSVANGSSSTTSGEGGAEASGPSGKGIIDEEAVGEALLGGAAVLFGTPNSPEAVEALERAKASRDARRASRGSTLGDPLPPPPTAPPPAPPAEAPSGTPDGSPGG